MLVLSDLFVKDFFSKVLVTSYQIALRGIIMATDKIQTGIRLEYDALEKIRFIAKKQKRTLNSLVEYLVEREINTYERENGIIHLDSAQS